MRIQQWINTLNIKVHLPKCVDSIFKPAFIPDSAPFSIQSIINGTALCCFQKKVRKKKKRVVQWKQVNICKSSDMYINIFHGRDENNHFQNMCFPKKSRKNRPKYLRQKSPKTSPKNWWQNPTQNTFLGNAESNLCCAASRMPFFPFSWPFTKIVLMRKKLPDAHIRWTIQFILNHKKANMWRKEKNQYRKKK